MEDRCPTHTSVSVTHLLFCRDCGSPLCAECWGATHEGHDVVPLRKQQQFANQSLQRCLAHVRDRKKESDTWLRDLRAKLGKVLMEEKRFKKLFHDEHGHAMKLLEEEYKRKKVEEMKRYHAQLTWLQQEVGGQGQELQTAVTQVADDVNHVETLLTQLRLLTLTAPVVSQTSVAAAALAAEAALQQLAPWNLATALPSAQKPGPRRLASRQSEALVRHPDLRQQIPAVTDEVKTDKQSPSSYLTEPVVVFNTSLTALLDYVSGASDPLPGPLHVSGVTLVIGPTSSSGGP